jgi:hypothetical protein
MWNEFLLQQRRVGYRPRITRDEYLRKQKQVGYQPRITQDQDPRKTPRWQHQCVAK